MNALKVTYSLALKGMPLVATSKIHGQAVIMTNICVARNQHRQYSLHPVSKNLELISTSKELHFNPMRQVVFPDGNESTRPLVVLMAWLLAKRKHLLKFADFYLEQGFDVLSVSIQPWQMLWPTRGTQVLATDLLQFLHLNSCYQPLMVHGFSVGGYVWAETLVKMQQDLEKYQPVVDRFVGQVWDSVADITEIPVGFPKAVFPRNPMLQAATEKYVRYHMSAFHNVATCHYIRASQMFHTTLVRAPALFFLSKTDPVGSAESISRCRANWEAQGIKTYMKCWDKSPHVLHYRHHPKEYAAELYAFMDRLGLLTHPEKFRAKL